MPVNTKFEFQGLDHVALGCSDMRRTVEFYNGTLGMPILHTLEYLEKDGQGNSVPMGQHFFFGVGGENPNAHIAFFYWKNGYQTLPPDPTADVVPPGVSPRAIKIGGINHLNLRVAQDKIEEYCKRLGADGIQYKHVTRYGKPEWTEVKTINGYTPPKPNCLMDSLYFDDPDGIHLEVNAWLPEWDEWRNDHEPWSDPRTPR